MIVDAIFLAGLACWLFYRSRGSVPAAPALTANIQIELRHLKPKLTEVDLVNNGTAPGSLDLAVDVSWPQTDLDQSQAMDGFDEFDTGRRSMQFRPQPSLRGVALPPTARREIGWIQLLDDDPINAQIIQNPPATQP
jgi:hypothetical protein